MKLLMITPYTPFPLTEGGKISQYALIDYLRKDHDISLVLTIYEDEDEKNIQALAIAWPNVTIHEIDLREGDKPEVPAPEYNKIVGASIRMLKKIVNKILRRGAIPKGNIEIIGPAVSEFEDVGITQLTSHKSRRLIMQLESIFSSENFDLIQIDHVPFIDLVYALPARCKKVFVHHEIRFARLKSYQVSSKMDLGLYEKYILNSVKATEISYLEKYDAIFTFSEEDKNRLKKELGEKPVYAAPFPVLDSYFTEISKENLNIKKFVFIGGEAHYPNKNAVEWFVEKIGSALFDRFGFELHVIGSWNTNTIQSLSMVPYIKFSGIVPDIIEYCKNSILLAPIQIGSGVRTKILYALAQGVPVISTPLGCEGLPVKHKESIMLADNKEGFLNAVQYLLSDIDNMVRIVKNAQSGIEKDYSQSAASSLRNRYYTEIVTTSPIEIA
jgi:hypothetical protein